MIIDFPVQIERKTLGVTERGFGTILAFDNTKDYPYQVINAEGLKDFKDNDKLFNLLSTLFAQRPQPQEVAVFGKKDGAAKDLFDISGKDFFFITSVDNSIDMIKGIASFADTNNKVYAVTVTETTGLDKIVSNNTAIVHSKEENNYAAEALIVNMSYDIGGKAADGETLQSVLVSEYDPTEIKDLEEKNISIYINKLGIPQIHKGRMMGKEWIDVVLGEYWIRFRMEERLAQLKANNKKIGYSNKGIGLLVGEVTAVLKEAVVRGIVMEGQFLVDYKKRAEIPTQEVASRIYSHIKWAATLEGAIQEGPIFGTLTNELVRSDE